MKAVFFYGLFMDADLLFGKGLNPTQVRPAVVHGYGLRIGNRATLEKSDGESVYGSVMQLSEDELGSLYSEQSVSDYRPQEIRALTLDGEPLRVESYILSMDQVSGKNSDYAKALADVARKIGLPNRYVSEIEGWI